MSDYIQVIKINQTMDFMQGEQGTGIAKVTGETMEGRTKVTVYLTDGQEYEFDVLHGDKGEKGDPYTHSEEFATLANDVRKDAETAQTAKTNAENAKTSAENAMNDALSAKTAAEEARTGAETAKTDAETAKEGAVTAKTEAENVVNGFDTHASQKKQEITDEGERVKNSIPEDYQKMEEDVSRLSESIDEISNLIEYDENLLKNDSAKENTAWRRTYGIPSTILQTSSNYCIAFDVIPIQKDKKYCATTMRNSVSYILYGTWDNVSGAYEGTYGTVQNLLKVDEFAPFEFVAENDGYLFCTMSMAYGDKATAMVSIDRLPSHFIKYGKKENAKFKNDGDRSIITVEKDGSGDYLTIYDAVTNAKDFDTIKIGVGVFVEELTIRDKFLYIIGSGIDCTVISNSNNTYENPPLEIAKGYVSNLTVYSKKENGASNPSQGYTPYAVHIDWVESCDTTLTFENCKLISDWNASAGIGLRKGFVLTFRNCILEANDNTNTNGALYYHDANNASTYGVGKIIIDNCRLHSKSAISVMPASSGVVVDDNSVYMSWYNSIAWSDINGKGNGAIGVGRPVQGDGWRMYNNFFLTDDSFGNNVSLFNA